MSGLLGLLEANKVLAFRNETGCWEFIFAYHITLVLRAAPLAGTGERTAVELLPSSSLMATVSNTEERSPDSSVHWSRGSQAWFALVS